MFIVSLFAKFSKFEKRETVNEEIQSKFIKMTVVQFINIAVIVLIVNFDVFEEQLFGFIPFFNGNQRSFDKRFYNNIGKTLQSALMMQIVIPQMKKLIGPSQHVFRRLRDRGFKAQAKTEDGKIRTKKILQEDLNQLYTGTEMGSEQIYA